MEVTGVTAVRVTGVSGCDLGDWGEWVSGCDLGDWGEWVSGCDCDWSGGCG